MIIVSLTYLNHYPRQSESVSLQAVACPSKSLSRGQRPMRQGPRRLFPQFVIRNSLFDIRYSYTVILNAPKILNQNSKLNT